MGAWENSPLVPRTDILLDRETFTDEVSGDWVSGWMSSGGTDTVRVSCHVHATVPAPTLTLEEAVVSGENDGTYPVRKVTVPFTDAYAYAEVPLSAAAFRLSLTGDVGMVFQLSVRSI